MPSVSSAVPPQQGQGALALAWFNPSVFQASVSYDDEYESIKFNPELLSKSGMEQESSGCAELKELSGASITHGPSPTESSLWPRLEINCYAAWRFLDSQSSFIRFWPAEFEVSTVLSLPLVTLPNAAESGLSSDDIAGAKLSDGANDYKASKVSEYQVEIEHGVWKVSYELVAKTDFNFDGIEDWFIRMDWQASAESSWGSGWVVLTKLSDTASPIVLWRNP